jgi:hypothetical protein
MSVRPAVVAGLFAAAIAGPLAFFLITMVPLVVLALPNAAEGSAIMIPALAFFAMFAVVLGFVPGLLMAAVLLWGDRLRGRWDVSRRVAHLGLGAAVGAVWSAVVLGMHYGQGHAFAWALTGGWYAKWMLDARADWGPPWLELVILGAALAAGAVAGWAYERLTA